LRAATGRTLKHNRPDYVVATTSALSDKTAIRFSACFYHALAFNRSVPSAVELAECQINMEGSDVDNIFKVTVRKGVDASEPFLGGLQKHVRPSTSKPDHAQK